MQLKKDRKMVSTSENRMSSRKSKPAMKRSFSTGQVPRQGESRQAKRQEMRYRPYAIPSYDSSVRRSEAYRSLNSPKSNSPRNLFRERSLSTCENLHQSLRKNATCFPYFDFAEVKRLNETIKERKQNRRERRESILDVARRLGTSLTIQGRETLKTETDFGNSHQLLMTNKMERRSNLPTHNLPLSFEETSAQECEVFGKTKAQAQNQLIGNPEEQSLDPDMENFQEFLLPSFDDEIISPEIFFPNVEIEKEKRLTRIPEATREEELHEGITKVEGDHSSPAIREFPDHEDVVQELRKAKTITLFDENDEEVSFDLGFDGGPLFLPPRSSLCEGEKAKLLWNQFTEEDLDKVDHSGDSDNNESSGNQLRHYFDLQDILSNDWLNSHPFLMTSPACSQYTDLSQMQGTFTCSMCANNLELDPFHAVESSFPFCTGQRSHECDVTLFCLSCSSHRVVYNANKLFNLEDSFELNK